MILNAPSVLLNVLQFQLFTQIKLKTTSNVYVDDHLAAEAPTLVVLVNAVQRKSRQPHVIQMKAK